MAQYTPDQLKAIADALNANDQALKQKQLIERFPIFKKQVLALDTAVSRAQAIAITQPFQSIRVESVTDSTTNCYFLPLTRDAHMDYATLGQADCVNFSQQIAGGFIFWDSQPGKSITLIFNLLGTFANGKIISVNSGGVSINEGSNAPTTTLTTLSAATAAVVAAADANRKVSMIQNLTGASIWVGPAAVTSTGSTIGFEVPAGATFIWKNTAALYAISVGGGNILEFKET